MSSPNPSDTAATWGVVRAADAGAPHGRARIFIVAADTGRERHGGREDGRSLGRVDREDAGEARQRERPRSEPGDRSAAAPADARSGPLAGTAAAGNGLRLAAQCGHDPLADADRTGCGRLEELHAPSPTGLDGEHRRHPDGRSDRPDWGPYTSAIRRWEAIIGRAAPRPTEPADRGGERLNPRFVEWMQGLSAGWVTDILPRNPALKALGNGVVPQQAALAVTALLSLTEVAA